jgi:serine O-acetyltransferase
VVVHPGAVIGENCIIGQGVTVGGRAGQRDVPIIGNNVLLGVGSKILGPVRIGDNAMVGANAVVIRDVPPNSTAVGVPARIVERKDLEEDWTAVA